MFGKTTMGSNLAPARLSAVPLASFAAVVLLMSLPARADVSWSTSSGDWSVAWNWGGTLPGSNDTAYIINGGTATISMPGEVCGALALGGTAGSGTVQMTAGGQVSAYAEWIGAPGATGLFQQTGGANAVSLLSIGRAEIVTSALFSRWVLSISRKFMR